MGGKRESTNGKASGKLLDFRKNIRVDIEVEYLGLDPELVLNAIDTVVKAGAAIMFGKTQDGGAYSVLVLHNDSKAKEYPHNVDEMHSVLQAIIATMEE